MEHKNETYQVGDFVYIEPRYFILSVLITISRKLLNETENWIDTFLTGVIFGDLSLYAILSYDV